MELSFNWSTSFEKRRERSAGGRRSFVEILFDKETWKGRAHRRHTRLEGWSLQNRKLQNRNSPANRILVHVLPHCPRGTGLHRGCVLNRDLKSGCQRDNQGKQNKASKRPAPQSRPATFSLCCPDFPHRIHSKPNVIIQNRTNEGGSRPAGVVFIE